MAVRLPQRTTRPSVNRTGLLGQVPRRYDVVRGSFLPAAPERSGYRRSKILLTNPAWLEYGPTRTLQMAQARSHEVAQRGIEDLRGLEAEKKAREAREERDAILESILLDDPQTFVDKKWPAATVRKATYAGEPIREELLKMLGRDPPARSKAEKSLKAGPTTTKKLVDYGVRKGYFERDPLDVAVAKAKASGTKSNTLEALGPKVTEYNTAINAYAKKYKVPASLGLSVDDEGAVQMDMNAFTQGQQTFYERMQSIADGTATDTNITPEEAGQDLERVKTFYERMTQRLLGAGLPILPAPGAAMLGSLEGAPQYGEARAAAAPGGAQPFAGMTKEQRRAHPAYQAYRQARDQGMSHEDALSSIRPQPGGVTPPATPPVAPAAPAAPTRATTQATPSFPTAPPNQLPEDPGVVRQMIDEMVKGTRLAAKTPIQLDDGQQVTLGEMADVVKENAQLIPGFLVWLFIENPIQGAKDIINYLAEGSQAPAMPQMG